MLTIIIWLWIPLMNVLERYINFLYVNMKILIYILEFKQLKNYSVAMMLNIVPPQWLHRWGSNSQHITFKSHRLKNMSLGNLYRPSTKQSRIHFHVYIESLFSWHFWRTQQSTPFDSQCIDGDDRSESKFIILSDYNLAWSRSKAFCERKGLEMFDERNGLENFAMQLWQTMISL